MSNSSPRKVAAVIGIGPGNGAALARRFSADGYAVALLSRSMSSMEALASELPDTQAFICDVSNTESIARAFGEVREAMGPVDTVVFNAGSGVFADFENVSVDDFELSWQVNARGLFVVAKEVLPAMVAAGSGNLIVIGATASRRGVPRTVAFAPAKGAQRLLTEALARQYGPKGVHVALIVIDGVIDLPRTREWLGDKDDDFFVKPSAVAALASDLVHQDRSGWTFEAEVRPFGETW